MGIVKYDTFEDTEEISKFIAKSQAKSMEYMSQLDAWDLPTDIKIDKNIE